MPATTSKNKKKAVVSSGRRRLDEIRRDHEAAKLEFQTLVYKKRRDAVSSYDAVEPSGARRSPKIEVLSEGGIYDMRKRALGASVGRDLERNYGPARSCIHQFRINVIGSLAKMQVNLGEAGDEAAAWFNQVWSKDVDFRDSMHWSEACQNVVAAIIREGDCLCIFDDQMMDDTGKLLFFESDQIVPMSSALFKKRGLDRNYTQDGGIVRDSWGRATHYVTTGKRGLVEVTTEEESTLWDRDNAIHVKLDWRFNQGRGVPPILASANHFQDLYEILSTELQSAKRAAVIAGIVKRSDAVTDWDDPASAPEFLSENFGKSSSTVAAEGPNSSDSEAPSYERFESLTGGYLEYVDAQDDVSFPAMDRPNIHLPEFIESVQGQAGAGLGLGRAYTNLHASQSYTAFRGDMILTWETFKVFQKQIERNFCDKVGIRALNFAMRKKLISPLPDGWERAISWVFPTMPHVDELKEQKGKSASLTNLTADWSQLIGPDWKRKLAAMSSQIEYARELNIPLAGVFGNQADEAPLEPDTNVQDDEDDEDDAGDTESSRGSGLQQWL